MTLYDAVRRIERAARAQLTVKTIVGGDIYHGARFAIDAIANGKEGMISMDQSLATLYREGKIHRETAMAYADHPESLARILN